MGATIGHNGYNPFAQVADEAEAFRMQVFGLCKARSASAGVDSKLARPQQQH